MSVLRDKRSKRLRRHRRVRSRIKGTSDRPRLSVFRSNKYVWAQLIDDTTGETLCAADNRGSKGKKVKEPPVGSAEKVGETVAKQAAQKKISTAVFDRGGYKYHGVVKAVADGARRGGLNF